MIMIQWKCNEMYYLLLLVSVSYQIIVNKLRVYTYMVVTEPVRLADPID
jgi:hypothetical protein